MPHPDGKIRLLSLDGGGVRGLSSLMILRALMEQINADDPPKPCDYFDMIGGTGTGGLIAVMLGRLKMTVSECIVAYTGLCERVFEEAGPSSADTEENSTLGRRFSSESLEQAIKFIITSRGLEETALMRDEHAPCKVFVCAISQTTGHPVCLANYRSPRGHSTDLFNITTIWQACQATSATTGLFDPITIGPRHEKFVDGLLGYNSMDTRHEKAHRRFPFLDVLLCRLAMEQPEAQRAQWAQGAHALSRLEQRRHRSTSKEGNRTLCHFC